MIPDLEKMYKRVLARLDGEFSTPKAWYGVKSRHRKFLLAIWGYGTYGDDCLFGDTQYFFIIFVKDAQNVDRDIGHLLAAVQDASSWHGAKFQKPWVGINPLLPKNGSRDIWFNPGSDRKGPRPKKGHSLPKTEQREVHKPRGRAATVVDPPKIIHLLLYDDQKRLGPSVYLDEQCTESTMPDGSDSSALRYKRDDGEELYLSIRG
ncbi:hypothetical protein QSH57_004982 [Fusarium oxysporum f. sp. vasinfectum]|nr:hypothetical protein QSH57_004982 [Fusarium oxysporum f. sp. vasinfectum]